MEGFENLTQEQRELCESFMAASLKHNGWRNYETWRVNLEYCADLIESMARDNEQFADVFALEDRLKESVEEFLADAEQEANTLVSGWASGFVAKVDFREIAQMHAESYPQLIGGVEEEC